MVRFIQVCQFLLGWFLPQSRPPQERTLENWVGQGDKLEVRYRSLQSPPAFLIVPVMAFEESVAGFLAALSIAPP